VLTHFAKIRHRQHIGGTCYNTRCHMKPTTTFVLVHKKTSGVDSLSRWCFVSWWVLICRHVYFSLSILCPPSSVSRLQDTFVYVSELPIADFDFLSHQIVFSRHRLCAPHACSVRQAAFPECFTEGQKPRVQPQKIVRHHSFVFQWISVKVNAALIIVSWIAVW
jgi:hypothetical protein